MLAQVTVGAAYTWSTTHRLSLASTDVPFIGCTLTAQNLSLGPYLTDFFLIDFFLLMSI